MPDAFETRSCTAYSPSAATLPLMMPVDASMLNPAGSPVASKVSPALPAAAYSMQKWSARAKPDQRCAVDLGCRRDLPRRNPDDVLRLDRRREKAERHRQKGRQ
jgi:hypothetical protein